MSRRDRRNRRRPMAEINVVPYIDVMLVLLVIFMVTAPMLTQGVKVDLPQADAQPQPSESEAPIVIHIDRRGELFIDLGNAEPLPVNEAQLYGRIRDALEASPATQVMVRADDQVDYGRVVDAMVAAQAAGADSVGLVTQPPLETAP